MQITLLRHAEPGWLNDGKLVPDPDLTALGRHEADVVARRLASERHDQVWVSPARRALSTVAPLLPHTPQPIVHDWLHEIRTDELVHCPTDAQRRERDHLWTQPLEHWWRGVEDSESPQAFAHRVTRGMDAALGELGIQRHQDAWCGVADQHLTIVSHGATSAVLIAHLLGLPPSPWPYKPFELAHAGVARLNSRAVGGFVGFALTALES